MVCTGKTVARPRLPYTRPLCSPHQCIALRLPHWILYCSQRPFPAVLLIMRMDVWLYASMIRPGYLIRPLLFSFVSDLSSSRKAASGISVPVICSLSWRKNCAIAKSHFHIPVLSHWTIRYSLMQRFRRKSTRTGAGNSSAPFPGRRAYFLQFHFHHPRLYATDGWRHPLYCASHVLP